MFYNDSYSKIIGPLKHPRFFGASARLPRMHARTAGQNTHFCFPRCNEQPSPVRSASQRSGTSSGL
jgi:hypothetical protein